MLEIETSSASGQLMVVWECLFLYCSLVMNVDFKNWREKVGFLRKRELRGLRVLYFYCGKEEDIISVNGTTRLIQCSEFFPQTQSN